ncbi:uncharacterized protein [Diadema setosum]|uniref:uncharacterized protein n=1 Tax=Diadema setosum TaxID=31175 RepID=UPI003B3A5787
MGSRTGTESCVLPRGFSASSLSGRTSTRVTFGRDTLQQNQTQRVFSETSRCPQFQTIPIRRAAESGNEKDVSGLDPILVSLVNFHSKLHRASGRSFDLVVGKLCHLLKTNGQYLETKYADTLNALFSSVRTLIIDQEKSEISRTRLLEVLELRARSWAEDLVALDTSKGAVPTSDPNCPSVGSTQQQTSEAPSGDYIPWIPDHQYPPGMAGGPLPPLPTECPAPRPPTPRPPTPLTVEDMTLLAKQTPFPDDTSEEEEDNQWETLSDVTFASESSDEFVPPEVQELMQESTSALDMELSRLLATKVPCSYRRTVNEGKPVRYTKTFLLNCWKSPFTKEMPPVLRHTICHSDISFIIQRHAFTDPKDLFSWASSADVPLLAVRRLSREAPGQTRPPRDTGRSRQRTLSCPGEASQGSGGGQEARGLEGMGLLPEGSWRKRHQSGDGQELRTLSTSAGARGSGVNLNTSLRRTPPPVDNAAVTKAPTKVQFLVPSRSSDDAVWPHDMWEQISSAYPPEETPVPKQTPEQGKQGPKGDINRRSSSHDTNNNGQKGGHPPAENEKSSSKAAPASVPTFSEAFREVIEKGFTHASKHPQKGPLVKPPSASGDSYDLRPAYQLPLANLGSKTTDGKQAREGTSLGGAAATRGV